MLLAGAVATVDTLLAGSIGVAPACLLVVGGTALAFRVLHAPRSLWAGGLKADLFLLGVTLVVGGLIEMLHAVDLLLGSAPHLGLAGTLAIGATWLLTREARPFRVEARVIDALHLAAGLMVVAAASGLVAVGVGEPHGRLASVSMLLLACAGVALVRAGTRTPAVGWQRL
jgi:hypothetical protein